MSKYQWIIEEGIFNENIFEFEKYCENFNSIKYEPLCNGEQLSFKGNSKINPFDNKTIFYGSIDLGKKLIKKGYNWQIWLPNNVFDCNYWMSHFRNYCYNQFAESVILPFGGLEEYFLNSVKGEYFIRPNSGYKLFSGHTIDTNNDTHKDLFILKDQYNIFPEDLILVSTAGAIQSEYRFVIAESIENGPYIIDACKYMEGKNLCISNEVPNFCYDFVSEILDYADSKNYNPCPAWTLDICVTNNKPYIMEFGSFTSAGLYNCNINLIVKNIELVLNEHFGG